MCIINGICCTLSTNGIEFLVYDEYSYSAARTP